MIWSNRKIPGSRRLTAVGLSVCLMAMLGGCLEEPEIDERWTLLEVISSRPQPGQDLAAGQAFEVSVSGRITYRAIRTGFLVAEVRYSDVMGPGSVDLDPADHSLATARRVEQILANSVTAGRGTRAVTGFDHLMQTIDFEFIANVPSEIAANNQVASNERGLFLLLYLAEGEEMELASGRDSLVVTPFPVDEQELLFTGFALDVGAPAQGETP